ncbi:MAG TPA: helix-turn-helix domain-containing protein [Candidatus Angelobacter sp.]|nr:helix-turn-helix domain-containing protein [Candidatus Angelobacter sp.]
MPAPGSLRRMPIDGGQIAELLSSQFNLPTEETRAYLKLLDTSDLTLEQLARELNISQDRAGALVTSMIEKGLIIEAIGTPKRYAPLHPRMTLTNIFKNYEKELVQSLRDRRATVDRVVNLLIPIYEERQPKGETKD